MQENNMSYVQRGFERLAAAARENIIPFLSALGFGLAAHMFAFSNKLMNADEIESLFGKGATVTSGRWGLELVKFIFPDASMPWLYGIVSLILLAVSACLIIRLFKIENRLMQLLLAGMLTAFPSQTGVFCFMFTSSAYALAFLLSVLCVWLFVRGGFVARAAATLCLLLSLGIYQAYVAVTASLFVLMVVLGCMEGEKSFGKLLLFALRALGMMLLALAAYYGISRLALSLNATEFNSYVTDNVNEAGILARIRMAYDFLYYTLSYMEFGLVTGKFSLYLHLICMGICVLALFAKAFSMLKERRLMSAGLMLFCCALLPLAVYCIFLVMDKGSIHTLVFHSFIAFYVLAAVLCETELKGGRKINCLGRDMVYLALSVALVSNIYLANKTYLKLYLQYENAYSFCSILLTRVQNTEGFDEDCTLAIIGDQDNKLTRFPQIDLGWQSGPSHDLVNIYSRENFLRHYLGSTIELADREEFDRIRSTPEFEQMSEYPYYGSVKKIDSYIVVKLG